MPPKLWLLSIDRLKALASETIFSEAQFFSRSPGSDLLALLTPERRQKVLRYKPFNDKLRSLGAGLLLSLILKANSLGSISLSPSGKPYLTAGGPYFSLSHSGPYAALLVANKPCGLDIEMISERPISPSLSQRVLTEIESALFEALKRSPEVFAAIWAIKESYMKASGLGLRALPDSFSVLPPWPKAKLLFKSYFIARPFKLPGARAAISYRLDGPRDFDPGPPLIWRAEPAIIKALKNRPNF